MALLAAIIFAAIFGLIAEGLARISFDRILQFNENRDVHYGRFATASAIRELHSCLQASVFPAPAACAGWSAWTCGATCSATRVYHFPDAAQGLAAVDIPVTATWDGGAEQLLAEAVVGPTSAYSYAPGSSLR